MKSYSELLTLPTLEERVKYLTTGNIVGERTFGSNRYLNQGLYRSREWKQFRDWVIVRDEGNDLALDGYPVVYKGIVHHINPLTADQIIHGDSTIFDPENVVLCSFNTHNAIHFGAFDLISKDPIVRRPNDTCPWKNQNGREDGLIDNRGIVSTDYRWTG